MFNSIFSSVTDETLSVGVTNFIWCLIAALAVGVLIAWFYTYKNKYTKSFLVTLALLPATVAMIIIMVNGNIGTGVAIAGAFSLVRFRSVPGTAKEIGAVFISMGAGLAIGMGYIGFSILFAIIVSFASLFLNHSKFGDAKETLKILSITIPEDLNYTNVFNDLFEKYTNKYTLTKVKTSNMGSLFKLTYEIDLISNEIEKDFLDELRIRNGNLDIMISTGVLGNEL